MISTPIPSVIHPSGIPLHTLKVAGGKIQVLNAAAQSRFSSAAFALLPTEAIFVYVDTAAPYLATIAPATWTPSYAYVTPAFVQALLPFPPLSLSKLSADGSVITLGPNEWLCWAFSQPLVRVHALAELL